MRPLHRMSTAELGTMLDAVLSADTFDRHLYNALHFVLDNRPRRITYTKATVMPLDPANFLRCVDEHFTQVRAADGRLLGCVPAVQPDTTAIADAAGVAFELRIGTIVAVVVDLRTQTPAGLPGFIPLDDADTDLAIPVAGAVDDADIGRPV